jgi:hypothetical protein
MIAEPRGRRTTILNHEARHFSHDGTRYRALERYEAGPYFVIMGQHGPVLGVPQNIFLVTRGHLNRDGSGAMILKDYEEKFRTHEDAMEAFKRECRAALLLA